MPIISTSNIKGGVGKSLICYLLLSHIADKFGSDKVCAIDVDRMQLTLRDMINNNPDPLTKVYIKDDIKMIDDIKEVYEWVIIDTAPAVDDNAIAAIEVSDYIVVPMILNPVHIDRSRQGLMQKMIDANIPFGIIINRVQDSKTEKDAIRIINDNDLGKYVIGKIRDFKTLEYNATIGCHNWFKSLSQISKQNISGILDNVIDRAKAAAGGA